MGSDTEIFTDNNQYYQDITKIKNFLHNELNISIDEKDPLAAEYLILNALYNKINQTVKQLDANITRTNELHEKIIKHEENIESVLTESYVEYTQKIEELCDNEKKAFSDAGKILIDKVVDKVNETIKFREHLFKDRYYSGENSPYIWYALIFFGILLLLSFIVIFIFHT